MDEPEEYRQERAMNKISSLSVLVHGIPELKGTDAESLKQEADFEILLTELRSTSLAGITKLFNDSEYPFFVDGKITKLGRILREILAKGQWHNE